MNRGGDGEDVAGRKPLSSIVKRVISGLVLAPAVAACLLLSKWTFLAMVAVAALISIFEWFGMAKAARHRYIYTTIGTFYLTASFASFIILRLADHGRGPAVAVLLIVWASDIGAYFTGKKFGGRKLAPSISPNKTWAGFAGAMVFPGFVLLGLIVADHFAQSYFGMQIAFTPLALAGVFLAGCLLGAAGQAGDLFVSWFKRKGGLKDTGQLIPGHGGLLDRIDSLLLVSPAFLLIFTLWLGLAAK